MPSKPTIVFVPGAWHGPESYAATMAELQSAGYPTIATPLPSVDAEPPLKSFDEDVKAIRRAAKRAVERGQDVIIINHSYGGIPTSEAVKGLEKGGSDTGGKASVVGLIYLAAFILPEGGSLMGVLQGNPLPCFQIDGDYINAGTPEQVFYHDVPAEAQERWAASLRHFSYPSMFSEQTHAGWKHIPTTYIYCDDDQALPYPVQQQLVQGAQQAAKINTEVISASHSPFLSKPSELAAAIRRAAGEKA